LDPSQEHDDAKYGACVGAFHELYGVFQKGGIWDQRMLEGMREVVAILRRGEGDMNGANNISNVLGEVAIGRCGRLADTITTWMRRRSLIVQ
jgi:hypothetical protein